MLGRKLVYLGSGLNLELVYCVFDGEIFLFFGEILGRLEFPLPEIIDLFINWELVFLPGLEPEDTISLKFTFTD